MKISIWRYVYIFVFILFVTSITSCVQKPEDINIVEVSVKECYNIEDFQSIVVGESTFRDVYKIVPVESICATSYGGFIECPMEDGGCIRIKFYGEEMIVGVIEVDSSSAE